MRGKVGEREGETEREVGRERKRDNITSHINRLEHMLQILKIYTTNILIHISEAHPKYATPGSLF